MACQRTFAWQSHRHYVQGIKLYKMNTKVSQALLSILLLTGCSIISSCSSEPVVQSDNVAVEQPKPLEDVIVASEDEVPTWDPSAEKTTLSSENTESEK